MQKYTETTCFTHRGWSPNRRDCSTTAVYYFARSPIGWRCDGAAWGYLAEDGSISQVVSAPFCRFEPSEVREIETSTPVARSARKEGAP